MSKDTSGAAFPSHSWHGMSIRDYFAAKAMQSLIPITHSDYWNYTSVAEEAYAMADAMLEARKS